MYIIAYIKVDKLPFRPIKFESFQTKPEVENRYQQLSKDPKVYQIQVIEGNFVHFD